MLTKRAGWYTLLGVLIIVVLLELQDIGSVSHAVAAARWAIPVLIVLQGISITLAGMAWCVLVRGIRCKGGMVFVLARWVREGINDLLPVAQIGGHLVGARILTFFGVKAGQAGGSVVVDVTMRLLAQLVFTLCGVAILTGIGVDDGMTAWIAGGIVLSGLGVGGFILVQRCGLLKLLEQGMAILADRWNIPFSGRIADIHDSVQMLYQRGWNLTAGIALHFLGLIVNACAIWSLFYMTEVDIPFSHALLIESLALAIKSLGFSIPGALGVQEGGYVLVGTIVGLPAPLMLAVSLIRRLRDVILGVPALAVWLALENGYLWGRVANKETLRTH